jgi:glycosyltransferase involved in cell wall biosynthesis
MNPIVDILLSTFNGQEYLNALLDSISSQSFETWRLIIRDDGSTDKSLEMVRSFLRKYPEKVKIIQSDNLRLGPKNSYAELLKHSNAPYCMFCDQDDVWLQNKIAVTYEKMSKIETDQRVPALVYTDLIVTDENLDILNESFFKFQNIATHLDHDKYYVLYKNPAAGCTIMINSAARQAVQPTGSKSIMHDWWIVIGCLTVGNIACLATPTILYRQHKNNLLGAEETTRTMSINYICRSLFSLSRIEQLIGQHRKFMQQAKEASVFFKFRFLPAIYFSKILLGKVIYPLISSVTSLSINRTWRHK